MTGTKTDTYIIESSENGCLIKQIVEDCQDCNFCNKKNKRVWEKGAPQGKDIPHSYHQFADYSHECCIKNKEENKYE